MSMNAGMGGLGEDLVEDVEVPDMELDFHVQFPTPKYDGSGGESVENNGNESFEILWPRKEDKREEAKELVVILLGWAGSKHKHLSKYSDIYLKRGSIVLRYISPVKALFVQTEKLPILANRLIRLVQDLQLESHPMFFHVFSNGGSFTYSCILNELEKLKDKVHWDIRGSIFDSAPAPRQLGKCFNAVTSIFGNLGIFRYLIASMIVISIVLQVFWYHFKSAVQMCIFGEQLHNLDPVKYQLHTKEGPLRNWLGRICKMKNHNYLFLYSDTDDLIPWTQVEEIADIVERRGNHVTKKKFIGSLHVQHYRKYPDEYIEAITTFIRHAMKTDKTRTVLWEGC